MHREVPYIAIRPRTRAVGHAIRHVPETESTQRLARAAADAGAAHGLVAVADRQTAGVGRVGRAWAGVGQSLYATVLLRPDCPAERLQLLPLAAGLALVDAVKALTRVEARLKWPNDLLHGDRKLGGVLVDAVHVQAERPAFVLVGIGVNGDARSEDFPAELRAGATSLSQAAGRHVCLPALLKLFLEAFEPRYEKLVAGEPETVWSAVRAVLGTLGRSVRVQTPQGPLEGEAVDLGPEGELLVRSGGRVHAVRWGECQELREAGQPRNRKPNGS